MRSIFHLATGVLPFFTVGNAASQPKVTTKNGTIVGRYSPSYDQDFFLGIPYALPPTGDRRFRPPFSHNETFDKFDASEYSPICVGYGGDDVGYKLSEDCLTLNVIRPSKKSENLPVAVWIHGGGYVMGGSGDRRYNLSFLVEEGYKTNRPFIGVSINYRLGPWGFLNSREIRGTGNTNLGLKDQRLALHWIKENIANFGGNPDKVTIWGESAGAASVGMHLIAYGGRDDKLFSAAIMESGSPIPYEALNDTDWSQPLYDRLVEKTGCDQGPEYSLDCLRHLSYEKLNGVLKTDDFLPVTAIAGPVVDGDFLTQYPSELMSSGRFVKCPIIIGANSDEGSSFAPRIPESIPFELILQFSGNFLTQASVKKLADLYPAKFEDPARDEVPVDTVGQDFPQDGPQFKRLAAFFGDYTFVANRRKSAECYAGAGAPVYSFRFNAYPDEFPPDSGAGHFAEVGFVFRNWDGLGYAEGRNPVNGTNLIELSKQMSSFWISFFQDSHDPNKGSNVQLTWPKYSEGAQNIVFQTKPQKDKDSYIEKDDFRKEGIAFMNSVAVQFAR